MSENNANNGDGQGATEHAVKHALHILLRYTNNNDNYICMHLFAVISFEWLSL